MKTNQGFVPILAIVIVAAIVAGGGYWVYKEVGGDVNLHLPPLELSNDEGDFVTPAPKPIGESSVKPTPTEPVACTMEAKMCPDGSAVGRTGPNCEFAQCPMASVIKTEKPIVNSNLTQEEKLNKIKEFLFPAGTTKEWRISNVIDTLYPGNTLSKKAAYLLVDLEEEMVASPKVKRDLNKVYSIFKCADYDLKPVTINGIDSGISKMELINIVVMNKDIDRYSNYAEASSNISAGSPNQYSSEAEACAEVFKGR